MRLVRYLNLKTIIDTHPTLDINGSVFTYENNQTHSIIHSKASSITNDKINRNNVNDFGNINEPDNNMDLDVNKNSNALMNNISNIHSSQSADDYFKLFSNNFTGTHIIIVEHFSSGPINGTWHSLKYVKFFSNHFYDIVNIKPIGRSKYKIIFDSKNNANLYLKSKLFSENGFVASIPSTLIFSYRVIKLDCSMWSSSMVNTLSKRLSKSLLISFNGSTPNSASLQILIKSSLQSLLVIPNIPNMTSC